MWHHPEVGADSRPLLVGIHSEDVQPTSGAVRDPGDHAHGGGLARPVGTEQPEGRPGFDLEVDAAHRLEGPVGLAQLLGQDHRIAHGIKPYAVAPQKSVPGRHHRQPGCPWGCW